MENLLKTLRLTTEIENILHYLPPTYLISCISSLSLCNKWPPNLVTQKTTRVYYITVPVGQECGCPLWEAGVLWLRASHKAATKSSDEAAVISRLNSGSICFQAHSCGCWQDLAPCWLLAGSFLSFLPRGLLRRAAYNMAACFIRTSKWENQRQSGSKRSFIT